MSETILRILLSELHTIRIVCNCKTVVEIPISKLTDSSRGKCEGMTCPGCGTYIRNPGTGTGNIPGDDAFDLLSKAWQDLQKIQGNFHIEFVLPVRDE
jgi:hypothetical protein